MFDPIKDGVVFYYRILNYMRNANFKKYTNMKFINLTGEWQKPNLGPGGGFLGILGGGMPPGSNPYPISD